MRTLRLSLMVALLWAAPAAAAPIFSDGFEDGCWGASQGCANTQGASWEVLELQGVNGGHTLRWTAPAEAPIEGARSVRWRDIPCDPNQPVIGGCFPAGVLYTEPARQPRTVGTYALRTKTRIQETVDPNNLQPLSVGGERFPYASTQGPFLWPPRNDGYAGGFLGGIVFNETRGVVEIALIYVEAFVDLGNLANSTVDFRILIREEANVAPAAFLGKVHRVEMIVRENRYIEMIVDGDFYGRVDTETIPGTALGLGDMNRLALVGLAGNEDRFDAVVYDDRPAGDANGDGIPDALATCPDFDGDGIGDAHDADDDGDGVPDHADTPVTHADLDGDQIPDECDADADGDACADDLDGQIDPTPPDCEPICGFAGVSHDCDGDGVSNDCEISCGADLCSGAQLCDNKPPSIRFVHPARRSFYVQDSMRVPTEVKAEPLFELEGEESYAAASFSVEARIDDRGAGVDPRSVYFEIVRGDGETTVVPNEEVTADPPFYRFRFSASGRDGETYDFIAHAADRQANAGSETSPRIHVVDATPATDAMATDVSDQYALVIEPGPAVLYPEPSVGMSNHYVLEAEDGVYTIRWSVRDYDSVVASAGRVVETCRPNLLFIGDAAGIGRALEAGEPTGFWRDPAHTVFRGTVDCDGGDPNATFWKGNYILRIPEEALDAVANQPVYVWAYVDVPDRASTDNAAGVPAAVDSASGFYSVLKARFPEGPMADRLDASPSPLFVLSR